MCYVNQVQTTTEKIISLELTTSPLSEEAFHSIDGLQPDSLQQDSLQTDIVQVVNPMLDGMAGQVTSISVAPPQHLVQRTEPSPDRESLRLELNTTFTIKSNGNGLDTPDGCESDDDNDDTPASTPSADTTPTITGAGKKKKKKQKTRKGKN